MSSPPASDPRLVVSTYEFAPADVARLRQVLGPESFLPVRSAEALEAALRAHPEADVVCSFRPPAALLRLAPNLRWIALPSAGADHVLRLGLVTPGGPIVTTANGVHAVPIAEFVLSMLLQWAHRWPELERLRAERRWPDHQQWQRMRGSELDGSTLGVIGLGAIGRQVARFGRALGMRVVATRHSAQPGQRDPDVETLLPSAELVTLLTMADYVVVCAPSTPATRHLLGASEFARMKPTAFLVNIARGQLIDEPALIAALRDGSIAGAGLDVFETEPLPTDSPLWSLPNVILTPHISGATDRYSERFTDLFIENITRWRAGEPLRNQVDPTRGY